MNKESLKYGFLAIIILMLFNTTLFGNNFEKDSTKIRSKKSDFVLELPLWIPGFKGNFSYGDISIVGDGNSGDYFSKLFDSKLGIDFYFVGKMGYNFDKWSIQTDVFGGQIRDAIDFSYNTTNIVDVEIFMIMPRLYASYKLYETNIMKKENILLACWIYGGIKYYHLNINADFAIDILDFEVIKWWIDPIIGYTIKMEISKWAFVFQNDYGGFGIGSDFSWWLQLHARYDIRKHLSVKAGWVTQEIKYSEDKIFDKFKYDVRLNGPMVGIAIRF
jgi:hypothetical protein